jgi:hypothetical protein
MQITREFDEPFSESTAALPSSFSAAVVGLAGRPYLMDTASGQYQRQAVDVVQQRNTSDNRDLLLLPQDIWRQMQQSWHYGAGQSNMDRDDALPYRYKDSFGIDPFTKWQLSLLPQTDRLKTLTGSYKCFVAVANSYLVIIQNQTLWWYTALSGSGTSSSPHASEIIDVTSSGNKVYTLHEDGEIWEHSSSSVYSLHIAMNASAVSIGWTKDHLMCGDGNELWQVTSTATKNQLGADYPDPAFRWIDFCDGPQHIYALAGMGDKWVVHKIGINATTAALQTYITAAVLPDGEIGYSIGSYLGYIFIGTSKGVRMAQPDANGDLTLGPIIQTSSPVYCFEGQDRFVWYGNSSMNGSYSNTQGVDTSLFPASTVSGLGRMDLSTFTVGGFAPAYADDLSAYNASAATPAWASTGTVRSVTTFLGKRVFAIDGVGVYFETSNLVEAGWIEQGTISFSVEDLKTALYTQAKWLPLSGAISIDLSYDSESYSRLVTVSTPNTIRSENISLNGKQFSRVDPRYVLKRNTTTTSSGPTFTRWEIRAFPIRGRAFRWTLPVMNYEQIEIDGVTYNRDVLSELDTLIGFVQSGSVFNLQESGRSYTVYGKDFLWRPERLSANGQGWQGVFILVVEEVQ